jgi:hypothetical protein
MTKTLGVALAMLAGVAGVSAHHSFAAEYDSNKPVNVSGTVMNVEWTNPHIHFWVDVKSADGANRSLAVRGISAEHARATGVEERRHLEAR